MFEDNYPEGLKRLLIIKGEYDTGTYNPMGKMVLNIFYSSSSDRSTDYTAKREKMVCKLNKVL